MKVNFKKPAKAIEKTENRRRLKKERVRQRIDRLDPNRRAGMPDDGFEHRSSGELVSDRSVPEGFRPAKKRKIKTNK